MAVSIQAVTDLKARDVVSPGSPRAKRPNRRDSKMLAAPPLQSLRPLVPASSMDDLSGILKFDHTPVLPKSKVICTVGSNSRSVEELSELLRAGMCVARFDFSWGSQAYHSETLGNLKKAMQITGNICATMMDTKGPEMTVDRMVGKKDGAATSFDDQAPPPIHMAEGTTLVITSNLSQPCTDSRLTINNKNFPKMVKEGDHIFVGQYLFTGAETSSVYFEVVSVKGEDVECRSTNSADLCGKMLIVQVIGKEDMTMKTVTPEDTKNIIEWAIPNKMTFISLSYTKTADCIKEVKALLAKHGSTAEVLGKLERASSLRNLDSILAEADGIILSRACLGLDIPVEKIPIIQKFVMQRCNLAGKSVIITRVMDSMTENPRPTRAEATDVANIVLDGADGIMLGAETLRGNYASLAVSTILNICKEAEKVFPHEDHFRQMMDIADKQEIMFQPEAVASSAVRAAMKVNAAMIIVFTETGTTARMLAKYRPSMPILSVIIPKLKSNGLKWTLEGDEEARRSIIYRGVFPLLSEPSISKDVAKLVNGPIMALAYNTGKAMGVCQPGSSVVVCQRMGLSATVKVMIVE